MEIVKELGSVAVGITVSADIRRNGENEQEKTNGKENVKHLTCHSE